MWDDEELLERKHFPFRSEAQGRRATSEETTTSTPLLKVWTSLTTKMASLNGNVEMELTEDEPSRSGLVNRQLPEMKLSTGDESSMTAPPLPIPHYLDATGRALYRFGIDGNAIST